jgi:hypothetical protein
MDIRNIAIIAPADDQPKPAGRQLLPMGRARP